MNAMKRNFLFIILLLALFTGQAEAQRRLPGMKAVRFTTEMDFTAGQTVTMQAMPSRWLYPPVPGTETSGCLAVRC